MGKVRSTDVGERLRLAPYWERALVASDRTNLIIDPGPSFGAGDHPSTVMALELLESAMKPPKSGVGAPSMLDVGTGTGVLAIAAALLGAVRVLAVDIDSSAVFTARRNLDLNGIPSRKAGGISAVTLAVGGAECACGPFDLVAANLAAPTLLRLSDILPDLTGLYLVLSGIADAMKEPVLNAYTCRDLRLLASRERSGWNAALLGRRSVTA